MLKKEYTLERFNLFLNATSQEYEGKYDEQLKQAWDSTNDYEDFQPLVVLRKIKENCPDNRRNLQMLLAHYRTSVYESEPTRLKLSETGSLEKIC